MRGLLLFDASQVVTNNIFYLKVFWMMQSEFEWMEISTLFNNFSTESPFNIFLCRLLVRHIVFPICSATLSVQNNSTYNVRVIKIGCLS